MTTRICAALLVLAVACGGGSSTASTPGSAPSPSRANRNSNVVTEQELQNPVVQSKDLLSALRALRPNFFAYRGPTGSSEAGAGEVLVSMDYGPLQSIMMLKQMNSVGLVEVRYLKPDEAALRFGLNANSGPVIVLLHNKNQ
jgi:hypothetical protein